MTSFDDASRLTRTGPSTWGGEIPGDWLQGRTAYGGLMAAQAVTVAGALAPGRTVRTLDVAFVAALPAGPVTVEARVLAAGSSVSSIEVGLLSEGVFAGRVLVTCGAGRPSDVVVPGAGPLPAGAADRPEPHEGFEFPFIPGVTPEFVQHLEFRWCGDSVPFSGAGPDSAKLRAWIRHRTPATGLPALVGLLDANPPTMLPMFASPRPCSTVRWGVHLVRELPPEAAADWFWFEAETLHAGQGYGLELLRVFHRGELYAWSEQLLGVYDKPRA